MEQLACSVRTFSFRSAHVRYQTRSAKFNAPRPISHKSSIGEFIFEALVYSSQGTTRDTGQRQHSLLTPYRPRLLCLKSLLRLVYAGG